MEKFQGTKGEWKVTKLLTTGLDGSKNTYGSISIGVPETNREWIASVIGSHVNNNMELEEFEANAKVMAASKDMLELLMKVKWTIEKSDHWWMDCPDKGGFDLELITNVINKATL